MALRQQLSMLQPGIQARDPVLVGGDAGQDQRTSGGSLAAFWICGGSSPTQPTPPPGGIQGAVAQETADVIDRTY